jgi:hypothetical protein
MANPLKLNQGWHGGSSSWEKTKFAPQKDAPPVITPVPPPYEKSVLPPGMSMADHAEARDLYYSFLYAFGRDAPNPDPKKDYGFGKGRRVTYPGYQRNWRGSYDPLVKGVSNLTIPSKVQPDAHPDVHAAGGILHAFSMPGPPIKTGKKKKKKPKEKPKNRKIIKTKSVTPKQNKIK